MCTITVMYSCSLEKVRPQSRTINDKGLKMITNKELYGVVQFINGKPILDAMPYFEDKEDALTHAALLEGSSEGLETQKVISCNIIRLYPFECHLSEDCDTEDTEK